MIEDGKYTAISPNGMYWTFQVKTASKGSLTGKTIVSLRDEADFTGIAFLNPNQTIYFWKRFWTMYPQASEIKQAALTLLNDPDAAGELFAVEEGRCYRCGRELTVPASIHRGMGPECARKTVTKKDNIAAYSALQQTTP
jgi:hypothetical protein